MRISEIFCDKAKPVISFEVFPPKTEEGIDKLIEELAILKKYHPAYISVTYGAGGTTQGRSIIVIKRIMEELNLTVVPHLTCIGSTPDSILSFIDIIKEMKIENIVALRGDHPKNNPDYRPQSNYFQYASDLVKFVREHSDLDIAVAGYPEVHPEAHSLNGDIEALKAKVDAGCSAIITQLFFNNDDYLKFKKVAEQKGIAVPIIPGILPITSAAQLQKVTALSGSKIPDDLMKEILAASDEDAVKKIGVRHAVGQINGLLDQGIRFFHLYPLNKAEAASKVLDKVNWNR